MASRQWPKPGSKFNISHHLDQHHEHHRLDYHVDHQGGEDAEDDEGAEDQPRAVPVEHSLHLHSAPHSFALDFPILSASISQY